MRRHSKNLLHEKRDRHILISVHGTHKLDQEWFKILQETNVQQSPIIIGIDEAARGPVFGPMVVAGTANLLGWFLPGIKDSKLIKSEKTRKALADEIRHSTIWAVATIPVSVINQYGTVKPLLAAGQQVAAELVKRVRAHQPHRTIKVIFDGRDHKERNEAGVHQVSIEKADATIFEVSCASIIAKFTHDGLIQELLKDPRYQGYDLQSCRGYGTPKHKAAIQLLGLSDQHRIVACETFLSPKDVETPQPAAPRITSPLGPNVCVTVN